MFPSDDIIIKNEPIKKEDTDDFVTDEDLFLQDVIIKCEKTNFPNDNNYDCYLNPSTTICTEDEYLAEGNVPFESIIVKEEPRFNTHSELSHFSGAYQLGSSNFDEKLEKDFECYICRYVPKNAFALRRHVRAHVDRKLFGCDQCDRKYSTHSGLYRHKLIHKGTLFACDQCDRMCKRKSTLKRHKLIHSGQKPFSCDECNRKFADSSTLYKHKRTHTGERPFACNLCDRRCSRKSTLDRHLKTHTGEKSFTCNVCDKKFSRNSTLNHHKLLHTDQNPFECNQCDRKFKTKSTLTYHLQTHTGGEKPFSCEECDQTFLLKSFLNQHRKSHNSGEVFSCDQCYRKYLNSSTLELHKIKHHKSPKVGAKSTTSRTNKKKTKYSILMNKCKNLRKT